MKSFLKWIILLTGLMPIVFSNSSLFPFMFPKVLYFRGLIFVAVIIFCITCAAEKKFRDEMIRKIGSLWKNAIFKWMTFFYISLLLSTIFAFDRYMAMFGTIEREGGFVGLFFFYVFFVLTTLVFEKKDWLLYFAVNIFTGGILFFVEIKQYMLEHIERPGSLTGNPIFLATYYLFIVFGGFVIWRIGHQKKNMLVMTLSVFSLIISLLGIFVTQSRGVIIGLFVGVIISFIYFGFCGKNVTVAKNISPRKFLVGTLVFFGLFFSVFVLTRRHLFWTHIPGVNRLAQISLTDVTTQSRIINASIVLHAVNPMETSTTRTLFGWGWDNYGYAWQKFYEPQLFAFEQDFFDRSHNRLLDALLMTGIIGLIFYIGLWFSFFREVFKKGKQFSFEIALFVFWGVAYFLQNLTIFDSMVTFITFYAMFAYLVYETSEPSNKLISQ